MICGFSIFEEDRKLVDKYTLRNEDGRELTDSISCIFVDLSFLSSLAKKDVSKMSPIEMWSVFLGGADNIKYRDKIDEITRVRKEIGMADELLHNLSMDENEWYHYRMRRKWKMDHDNDIIVATEEGRMEERKKAELEKAEIIKQAEAAKVEAEAAKEAVRQEEQRKVVSIQKLKTRKLSNEEIADILCVPLELVDQVS